MPWNSGHANERLLKSHEAAKMMGLTPRRVRMLADEGKLPFTRTQGGHKRYRHEDVRRCRISLSQRKAWKVRKLEAKKAAKERITLKNIKQKNWVISPRDLKDDGRRIEDHRHYPN